MRRRTEAIASEPYAHWKALERLGLSVVGAGRLFGAPPCRAQRWAPEESPIPWQVRASLTLMLHHELKPLIALNDTQPVPHMDQIVIALLQQTGETLESALQGFGTRRPRADRIVGLKPAPGLSGWHAAHIHSDASRL